MVSIGHALVCCTSLHKVMFLSLKYHHNVKHILLLRFDSKSILRSYLPKNDQYCEPTTSMAILAYFPQDWMG